jgi:hypothetical protein
MGRDKVAECNTDGTLRKITAMPKRDFHVPRPHARLDSAAAIGEPLAVFPTSEPPLRERQVGELCNPKVASDIPAILVCNFRENESFEAISDDTDSLICHRKGAERAR